MFRDFSRFSRFFKIFRDFLDFLDFLRVSRFFEIFRYFFRFSRFFLRIQTTTNYDKLRQTTTDGCVLGLILQMELEKSVVVSDLLVFEVVVVCRNLACPRGSKSQI